MRIRGLLVILSLLAANGFAKSPPKDKLDATQARELAELMCRQGVPDLLPRLSHKQPQQLRMDDYFCWPSVGDHRRLLQNAVRDWLKEHPDGCGTTPVVRVTEPTTWKSRMSEIDFAQAQSKFSRLHLGMSPRQVLEITGEPDAVERGSDEKPYSLRLGLLGICANDHNENLAYIYFIERWAVLGRQRHSVRL